MADPTGIPTPPPLGGVPKPTAGTALTSGPRIPTFAPPDASASAAVTNSEAYFEKQGEQWVWDKLGRFLVGTDTPDEQGKSGGLLGDVPVLGAGLRGVGTVASGVALDPAGFGIGKIVEGAATTSGVLPSISGEGLGTNLGYSQVDPTNPKYDPTSPGGADNAMALFVDLRNESRSREEMASQFLVIGKWMKQYDAEAFAEWEETLAKAQSEAGFGAKGTETISNFISDWGTTYSDLTTRGLEDYLETAPELYFGGAGSFGQGLVRDLGVIFNLQRHAEKGASVRTGSRGGGIGPIPVGDHKMYAIDGVVQQDMGSRLNELRWALANEPDKMTDIEQHAAVMIESGKWDAQHAYNFLVSKGQGYSSNAAAQMVLSFALDPLQVGSMGAGLAASVGTKAAYYGGKTAVSAGRIRRMYEAGARSIGTTVNDVRADPILGPAAKISRTLIDPFSALPGASGQATKNVLGATGLEATRRGHSASAVSNAARRSKEWGISEVFTRDLAVTSTNYARKWAAADYIANTLKFTNPNLRQVLTPEFINALASKAPKDAVSRMADFVQRQSKTWLRAGEIDRLASRMAKMTGKTKDEMVAAIKTMEPEEQSLWHALTYSNAWTHFKTVVDSIPSDEWGHLAQRLDDMVILNPGELDAVAADALYKALKDAKTVPERIRLWNEAVDQYGLIEEIGRVPVNAKEMMSRNLDELDRIIQSGNLHTALSEKELAHLPKKFVDEFMSAWTEPGLVPGVTDDPLWRIGFKPSAQQATGLIQNAEGEMVQRFAPSVDNVTSAPGMMVRRNQPLTDALGRVVGDPLRATKAGRAVMMGKDSLEVAVNTARDQISGARIIQGMEDNFVRSVKADTTIGPLLSEKKLRTVFKIARDAAQEDGFNIAGMGPKQFWEATQQELDAILEARVVKRELFGHIAKAAAGDLRHLGLTSHMTQRIRGSLIARGLDPNNYLGAVTVQLYNTLRYTLNPTFFLQSVFDSPWFNAYKGLMPIGGSAPTPGTSLYETERITKALGHSGVARDLQMDFTERVATIGWQRDVVDRLGALPGVKETVGHNLKNWFGRMMLNNQLNFVNSKVGDVVFDALDATRAVLDDKIANAVTDIERQGWQAVKQDQLKIMEHMDEQFLANNGRKATREELGRQYLTEMIDDSRLEVRTADGLLNYKKVRAKGEYIKPTDVGKIESLDLEYGVEALALPNIHSVTDLRLALADKRVFIGDIKDIMKREGFHKDAIKRFTKAVTFNWRYYFGDLATELKLTRYEMQGVEDIINRAAKAQDMKPVDYLTQVMELSDDAGLDANVRFIVQAQKAIAKGESSIDDVVQLASMHLQPSMRNRLIHSFMKELEGTDGLIQKAMDGADAATDPITKAAYVETAQQLQKALEKLKGGWGTDAKRMYKDLILRRAGGDLTAGMIPDPAAVPPVATQRTADPVAHRAVEDALTAEFNQSIDQMSGQIEQHLDDGPLYARWSPDIEADRVPGAASAGLMDRSAKEAGISSIEVKRGEPHFGLDRQYDMGAPEVQQFMEPGSPAAGFARRDLYLVRGKKVGSGWDGEPLLDPESIEVVTRVPFRSEKAPPVMILDPEIERGVRFFSQYIQSIDPKVLIGNELNAIVENIPVAGASPYDFTQGLLMNTLAENFRLAEKDAIRLAHVQPDRSVLERSINHPFFGMYPSSYFWGKVIPETFKFVALEPFGMKTTLGAEAYLKVQQSIALQQEYDPRMAKLWDDLGKSAVVNLLAYLSPAMPWEDMASNLPPWVRAMSKDGFDFSKMYEAQFRTMSPERWVSRFADAAGEIGDAVSGMIPKEPATTGPGAMSVPGQQGLEDIVQTPPPLGGEAPVTPKGNIPATKGTGLGPVLADEMTDLEKWLAGE